MVNPLGHWLWVPFCARSRTALRGLSGSWGTGFRIPLRGLSGFRFPLGLVVPAHPLRVPVCRSFDFLFFCCFEISGSHCSMVPYRVVFCDIACKIFLSLFLEYVEIFLSDSVSDPINSNVYLSRSFLIFRSVDYDVCRYIVRCHRCGWLLVAHPW